MGKILLIEPNFDGHRGLYVTWIAKSLIASGKEVLIGTLDASLAHRTMIQLRQEQLSGLDFISVPLFEFSFSWQFSGANALIKRELYFRRVMGEIYLLAVSNYIVTETIVPFLDHCAHAFSLLGAPFFGGAWSGIVMRQSFHYESMGISGPRFFVLDWKRFLFFRLLKSSNLRRIFTIDRTLKEFVDKESVELSQRLVYLPDPVDIKFKFGKKESRKQFGIPAESWILLVYGALTRRKGIERLIESTGEKEFPEKVCILMVGRQSREIENFLAENKKAAFLRTSERLIEVNKFVDEDVESAVFVAADAVWLGYEQHYNMSGVLVQAGLRALPVFTCDVGLLSWYVKSYGLGLSLNIRRAREVSMAVSRLVNDPVFAARCGKNGMKCFASHSVADFTSVILNELSKNIA